MKTYVIETDELTKTYKKTNAVNKVTLKIPKGEIFGLIGENGAGKSTLMKMLSGLVTPTNGDFKLFGNRLSEDEYIYKRVGVLIEEPGLLKSMTAYENMKTKALAMGCFNDRKIKELLSLCDISNTGKKKVKSFSLGMKQRLAIALALVGNPDLLILDEPTNGIDPKGFESIRKVLKRLSDEQGKTILISSHILEELSKVATSYGIMKNGNLVECVSSEELQERCQEYLYIKVGEISKACAIIEQKLLIYNYRISEQNTLNIFDRISPNLVLKELVSNGIDVYECSMVSQSLEQYFLSKNGGIL